MSTLYTQLKKKKIAGFTLLETLVAIGVLSIALGTTLTLAQKVLSTSYRARDQITAFFLAAEGVELVRNIRDNRAIENVDRTLADQPLEDWLGEGYSSCYTPQTASQETERCMINPLPVPPQKLKFERCEDVSCPYMTINADGIYGYDPSGEATQFRRVILLKETVGPAGLELQGRQARVIVRVFKGESNATPLAEIQETIFNWR